jgi:hypothetical protein
MIRRCVLALPFLVLACSATPPPAPVSVAPAPPPRDDGKPAQGGTGGSAHAAALENLKTAPLGSRVDKQNSIRVKLPDAEHWMRVKFWGVPSLVGFRYGKDHHAIVAGYITHVDDNSQPGVCVKSFEGWAKTLVEAFDVEVQHEAPQAVVWNGHMADITPVFARTATIAMKDSYAVAYGTYPAWKGACLVVGVAVPAREEVQRAREVRDRFVKDVLPNVEVLVTEEPKERY